MWAKLLLYVASRVHNIVCTLGTVYVELLASQIFGNLV